MPLSAGLAIEVHSPAQHYPPLSPFPSPSLFTSFYDEEPKRCGCKRVFLEYFLFKSILEKYLYFLKLFLIFKNIKTI